MEKSRDLHSRERWNTFSVLHSIFLLERSKQVVETNLFAEKKDDGTWKTPVPDLK